MTEPSLNKLFIPVILGTARKGRKSETVAKAVIGEFLKLKEVRTELIDVKDFPFSRTVPSWEKNEIAESWRKIVKQADSFIIVSPEYNYSFPGELKFLLDSAYEEYEKKPAAICGVSDGPYGGARMMASLRIVLVQLGLTVVRSTVLFSFVDKMIENQGKIPEMYEKNLDKLFTDITWYAKVLKEGRTSVK